MRIQIDILPATGVQQSLTAMGPMSLAASGRYFAMIKPAKAIENIELQVSCKYNIFLVI